MKHCGAVGLIIVMVGFGIVYGWFRIRSEFRGSDGPSIIIGEQSATHRVTPSMFEASRGMVLRRAPEFSMEAIDGMSYSLRELLRHGPVLLTFIKIGCPCSEAAQPYFNRFQSVYPEARILGVIDGELGPAKLWARKIRVSYPVLLDPDLELVRAFSVENSAYSILVDQQGQIAMYWPGYSASMLQELGSTLARLTQCTPKPIDVADAPAELYTGCPYEL